MFDYKNSLNGIKANLFDIYENQEQMVGLEKNEIKRNKRLNKFIEIKDLALMLLEEIESLYITDADEENSDMLKLENPKIPEVEEKSKILDLVQNNDSNNKEADTSNDEKNLDKKENIERYYLDCDKKRINFAYVPVKLFNKLKENGSLIVNDNLDLEDKKINSLEIDNSKIESNEFNEDESFKDTDIEENSNLEETLPDDNKDMIDYSRINKVDKEKPKGIIVRSDQYMKLALSRHRQEGVIKEAKIYRINEAKKKQIQDQKLELEKAKVDINI